MLATIALCWTLLRDLAAVQYAFAEGHPERKLGPRPKHQARWKEAPGDLE